MDALGRKGHFQEIGVFEQGYYGQFQKTNIEGHGRFCKERGANIARDHTVHVGDDFSKKFVAVLEGVLAFQLLKDIMLSLKKEVDRWLVKLEMGLELNGAGNVEGPAKGISKDPREKALVGFVQR